MVTLTCTRPQIQGFFRIPVDDLYAQPVLCEEIVRKQLPDLIVVSPTRVSSSEPASMPRVWAPPRIVLKRRKAHDERAQVLEIIGEVRGKTALIVDDFTITAITLVRPRTTCSSAVQRLSMRQ